jgi:hypothetical protein
MIKCFLVGYDTVALLGVVVVLFVMQKTEHDKINRLAPKILREMRRLFFVLTALLLLFSIWDEASYRSLVILVAGGLLNFLINAIALQLRTPPDEGPNKEAYSDHNLALMGYRIVKSDIMRLDQGQLLMIKMLEDIRNSKEINPGPAIIDPDPVIIHPSQFRPRT